MAIKIQKLYILWNVYSFVCLHAWLGRVLLFSSNFKRLEGTIKYWLWDCSEILTFWLDNASKIYTGLFANANVPSHFTGHGWAVCCNFERSLFTWKSLRASSRAQMRVLWMGSFACEGTFVKRRFWWINIWTGSFVLEGFFCIGRDVCEEMI